MPKPAPLQLPRPDRRWRPQPLASTKPDVQCEATGIADKTRRAPHKPQSQQPGTALTGARLPALCRGLPDTAPMASDDDDAATTPLPPVRSLSPPTGTEEPSSRSRHDAAAAPRRPQEVPPAGLVARIPEIARRRRNVAKRSARWHRAAADVPEMLRRSGQGTGRASTRTRRRGARDYTRARAPLHR